MRVCELIPAPAFGGAETLATELAGFLREAGHAAELAAIDPPESSEPVPDDGIHVLEPATWGKGKKLRRLSACREMLHDDRFDVVHAHSYLPNLYARLGAIAARSDVPIVVTLHSAGDDFADPLAQRVESALLHKTSAVVAVSGRLLDSYREHFPQAVDRTQLIPNGVTKASRNDAAPRARPRKFGLVGRIALQKDIETAIRGFGHFSSRANDPELELHVIGPESDKNYADRLRALTAELGCSSVYFRGAISNPLSHGEIDVLVHSAAGEAAPFVLLEAAANHVPIICTTTSLESGWLGESCRAFAPGDWRALSAALTETVAEWDAAIIKAKQAWEAVPDFRETVSAYERLMADLVANAQRRS